VRLATLLFGAVLVAHAPLPAQEAGAAPFHLFEREAGAWGSVPTPRLSAGAEERVDVAIPVRRGPVPPGLLRFEIPDRARPYAGPYAVGGIVLLATDPMVMRALGGADGEPPIRGGPLRPFARAVSRAGDLGTVATGLAGLYFLAGERERDAARVAGVAYVNALAVTAAGKFLLGKERPATSGGELRYHGPGYGHTSFPSAHASGSAAIARVMADYYPDGRVVFYGLSTLTGASRVALGRHWPSDVWWGWAAGLVAGEGALAERERIENWNPW